MSASKCRRCGAPIIWCVDARVYAADTTTVREACRQRKPLDGANAQALEGALAQVERQLKNVNTLADEFTRRVQDRENRITELESSLARCEQTAEERRERAKQAEQERDAAVKMATAAESRAAEAVEVLRRQEWLALGCGVARCPECGAVSDLENGQWQGDHHDDCALAACLRGVEEKP